MRRMELVPFHLAVPVHDLAAARGFYGGVLGCAEGRSSERWVDFDFFGHQLVAHLSPEEAGRHPWRHVITRALGSRDDVEAEVWAEPLRSGDIILLCSDGLNSMAEEEQILGAVCAAQGDLDEACRRLIGVANAAGGEDNITVVLLAAGGDGPSPETP